MPGYKMHICAGFVFFIAVYLFFPVMDKAVLFLSAVAAFIGSVFPDVDQKNSKSFRILRSIIVAAFSIYIIASLADDILFMSFVLAVWLLSANTIIISLKPRHRGIMHSVLSAFVFSLFFSFASFAVCGALEPGLFAFVGYVSHIALDRYF